MNIKIYKHQIKKAQFSSQKHVKLSLHLLHKFYLKVNLLQKIMTNWANMWAIYYDNMHIIQDAEVYSLDSIISYFRKNRMKIHKWTYNCYIQSINRSKIIKKCRWADNNQIIIRSEDLRQNLRQVASNMPLWSGEEVSRVDEILCHSNSSLCIRIHSIQIQ